jgi:D-alanyl-D-alanine carboxypeptidase
LYGGRVLPPELVNQLTAGDGEYGLGTMLFSQQFGTDPAYGHRGDLPDHSSLLIVIPAKKLAVSLLLADGNKRVDTAMTQLVNALQPILS